MHLNIVGGGWAGLSAAVQAVQRGWSVSLWEASRQLGGRARTLDHGPVRLDNGQHILIGAYTDTLNLMRMLGIDPESVLLRQPLSLVRPDGSGLALPHLSPPWNVLIGVWQARGWSWQDRLSLLRCAWQWRRQGFACAAHTTVADLCAPLTPRVMQQLIEPLCVSALNTPAHAASAAVMLRVLRDALWSGAGSSDVLLPTTDLGALLPDAAAAWLRQRGASVHIGQRWSPASASLGTAASPESAAFPGSATSPGTASACAQEDVSRPADALVLACPAWEAARLTAERHPQWSAQAQALSHAPITTVYVQHPDPAFAGLPQPMLALPPHPQYPAQFVFDRGRLFGPAQRGLLACVISDSAGTREALEQQVLAQLKAQLPALLGAGFVHDLRVVQTVVEKRATFVCTPGLQRPASAIGPGWWACGDYVAGPYPATLEGAVRSGREVIDQIAQAFERERRL